MCKTEVRHPDKHKRLSPARDGQESNVKAKRSRAGTKTTKRRQTPSERAVGVVGLGLMGTSIVACLLAAGHRVIGVTRKAARPKETGRRTIELLRQMKKEGFLEADPSGVMRRFAMTEDFAELRHCRVVIESIVEDLGVKRHCLRQIEAVVTPETIIGSNTSAIPVTLLQDGAVHPERILGIHWAEPAHITRFMEIIAGDRTEPLYVEQALSLARHWGKDPTCVRRDIPGFITNRLMYAMLREACYLVENGYATPEDVDRSAQNDMGWWMTFAGPFRFMDLTGIPGYAAVMGELLPNLCNTQSVPAFMKKLVQSGAKGVANTRGFYAYTPGQAKRWERSFLEFTYDVRRLALKYSNVAASKQKPSAD
jgi:3-hydroxybutyryl-CoA dehydrogenase